MYCIDHYKKQVIPAVYNKSMKTWTTPHGWVLSPDDVYKERVHARNDLLKLLVWKRDELKRELDATQKLIDQL